MFIQVELDSQQCQHMKAFCMCEQEKESKRKPNMKYIHKRGMTTYAQKRKSNWSTKNNQESIMGQLGFISSLSRNYHIKCGGWSLAKDIDLSMIYIIRIANIRWQLTRSHNLVPHVTR